jgi:hypothetical protein
LQGCAKPKKEEFRVSFTIHTGTGQPFSLQSSAKKQLDLENYNKTKIRGLCKQQLNTEHNNNIQIATRQQILRCAHIVYKYQDNPKIVDGIYKNMMELEALQKCYVRITGNYEDAIKQIGGVSDNIDKIVSVNTKFVEDNTILKGRNASTVPSEHDKNLNKRVDCKILHCVSWLHKFGDSQKYVDLVKNTKHYMMLLSELRENYIKKTNNLEKIFKEIDTVCNKIEDISIDVYNIDEDIILNKPPRTQFNHDSIIQPQIPVSTGASQSNNSSNRQPGGIHIELPDDDYGEYPINLLPAKPEELKKSEVTIPDENIEVDDPFLGGMSKYQREQTIELFKYQRRVVNLINSNLLSDDTNDKLKKECDKHSREIIELIKKNKNKDNNNKIKKAFDILDIRMCFYEFGQKNALKSITSNNKEPLGWVDFGTLQEDDEESIYGDDEESVYGGDEGKADNLDINIAKEVPGALQKRSFFRKVRDFLSFGSKENNPQPDAQGLKQNNIAQSQPRSFDHINANAPTRLERVKLFFQNGWNWLFNKNPADN